MLFLNINIQLSKRSGWLVEVGRGESLAGFRVEMLWSDEALLRAVFPFDGEDVLIGYIGQCCSQLEALWSVE